MRTIALKLSDADRAKVAAYYAALPAPPRALAKADADGAVLFLRGDTARGLAPCASCHGANGEGDAANPPLAGQPAAYLEAQLAAWRTGRRNNDPLGEMRAISRRLSPSEARAVSAYAEGLSPSPPPGRAASRAAHRGDPRNDASAPRRHGSGSSPPAE
ncbi:MAG: c-type cytochrome [Sphingomonadales bacterium]|nr:MAG: c-type cytochrome [Sphingomonadales bacterium]